MGTHGIYKGYNEKNEFCNGSEYSCENNLCKCQKKLIQDMMNLSWSGVHPPDHTRLKADLIAVRTVWLPINPSLAISVVANIPLAIHSALNSTDPVAEAEHTIHSTTTAAKETLSNSLACAERLSHKILKIVVDRRHFEIC